MSDLASEVRSRVAVLAEQHGIPGVAVGVDLAGETFFANHGITHVDHPLPVDENTLFQIASNSKPFTATLVMQLVEEGRLGLDDPVRRHLPEFHLPDRRYDDVVTIRHLLTHRVGWDGDAIFVRQPRPPHLDNFGATMERARQLGPPGELWTYSNAAFTVAGRLVEILRAAPFASVLHERILAPLRMSRTTSSADDAIFHRVAMRHLSRPGRRAIALPSGGWQSGWEMSPVDVPAGGVISSTADLLRWLRFWLGRPDPGSDAPLGEATRAQMIEDQVAPWNETEGQAIGWAVRLDPAARVVSHNGLTAGYCSFTAFVPSLDLAIAVLTNGTSGGLLHKPLTRWIVGEVGGKPWRDPAPLATQPPLARYTGEYWGSFGITRVREADGELELETDRHSTEDGSWQPPPEPPMRARLCSPVLAIAHAPEAVSGTLIDFDSHAETPAWLRFGGRIAVRV